MEKPLNTPLPSFMLIMLLKIRGAYGDMTPPVPPLSGSAANALISDFIVGWYR